MLQRKKLLHPILLEMHHGRKWWKVELDDASAWEGGTGTALCAKHV